MGRREQKKSRKRLGLNFILYIIYVFKGGTGDGDM